MNNLPLIHIGLTIAFECSISVCFQEIRRRMCYNAIPRKLYYMRMHTYYVSLQKIWIHIIHKRKIEWKRVFGNKSFGEIDSVLKEREEGIVARYDVYTWEAIIVDKSYLNSVRIRRELQDYVEYCVFLEPFLIIDYIQK